jgi:hypothetical protein
MFLKALLGVLMHPPDLDMALFCFSAFIQDKMEYKKGILMYWPVQMKCVKRCVIQANGEGTF